MSNLELQKFFDFNESDLTANRSLKPSQRQMERLVRISKGQARYYRVLTVGLILLGLFLSYIFYRSEPGNSEVYVGIGVVWLILGIFIALFLFIAGTKPDYTVEIAEGKVNFVKVEKTRREKSATGSTRTRTYQVYEMRVGNVNFHAVPEDLLNMIEEGDIYAVYYLPNFSQKILSLEFVKKGG
jgi:hypothetical protein